MIASDAIGLLIEAIAIERVGIDAQSRPEYDFRDGFHFVATELDDSHIRLAAPFPALTQPLRQNPELALPLLAANLQGNETGAGQIALDPIFGPSFVEVIETAALDAETFRMRFVNFSLYVEYWHADGISQLIYEAATPQVQDADVVMRL